jgi:hypothetical protein
MTEEDTKRLNTWKRNVFKGYNDLVEQEFGE